MALFRDIDRGLAWLGLSMLTARGTREAVEELARNENDPCRLFDDERLPSDSDSKLLKRCRAFSDWPAVITVRDVCRNTGIATVSWEDKSYPDQLRSLDDPPILLYYRGKLDRLKAPSVAIVGARRATRYGKKTAERLARFLADRGIVVVSGLAIGVDAAAHRGAIDEGLTIAVLAGGLDRIYPAANAPLGRKIAADGLMLGENPPGTPTLPHFFPIRNRIVTGLCDATIVVEAGERSGSLVSARWAMEQGREVVAVPGPIDSPTSAGTNRLIRDGCRPLVEIAELGEILGLPQIGPESLEGKTSKSQSGSGLRDPIQETILIAIRSEPKHIDELVSACRLDEAVVMEKLTRLELSGLVERLGNGCYARK